MEKTRIELLRESLLSNPDATFIRYALGVELSSAGQPEQAWQQFEYLLARHPEYSATYFQAGKLLSKLGRREDARKVLAKGIEVTGNQENAHAQSELQAALDELQEN
jgi:tetratricopeptide (TPR) repeat protein